MTYEELQKILIKAGLEVRYYNLDESERLCNVINQAIENEELTNDEKTSLQFRVLHISGLISSNRNQLMSALEKFNKALSIALYQNNRTGESRLLDEIGGVYWRLSDYPRALEYYHKSLAITEELGVQHDIAKVLADIGLVYMNLDEYSRALNYYLRALTIAEAEHDKASMTIYLGNVGNVYGAMEDYERCLEYNLKGLAIAKELGSLRSVSAKTSNIGIAYSRLNDYHKAMEHHREALSITESLGDKYGISICFINMADLLSIEEYEEYDLLKAIEYALSSLRISEEIGDKHNHCITLRKLAEIYKKQKSWELFALSLEKHHILDKEIQSEDTKRIADKYAYELQIVDKEKQIAIEQTRNEEIRRQQHILEEQAAKIQLTNTELQERNIELDNAYLQLSEQAAKIQLKNTELQEANIELNAANLKLEEAGRFKMKILGIASHDLKNPIAGINLSAEVLMRYEKLSPQSTKMMKNIMNSSKRMLDIVVNLMDVSARELGVIKLTHTNIDIAVLTKDVCNDYLQRATEKKQTVEFFMEGNCIITVDTERMRQVLDNIISNAVKYSEREKAIRVSVFGSQGNVTIRVADQGQGLSEEDKLLLFNDFQKLSARPTGGESSSGLGLSVVKHLVDLHGGRVWAESEGKGKGSTFFVELPR